MIDDKLPRRHYDSSCVALYVHCVWGVYGTASSRQSRSSTSTSASGLSQVCAHSLTLGCTVPSLGSRLLRLLAGSASLTTTAVP